MRKQIEVKDAQNKFIEIKEGLKSLRMQENKARWDNTRRFEQKIKLQMDQFKMSQKKITVDRKKEIQQLFAAKCRVAPSKAEPTEAEMMRSMLGDVSMLPGKVRDLSKSILIKKGMLKPQTQ